MITHKTDPHWRWVRAQELLRQNKNPSRTLDDEWTALTFQYLRRRASLSRPDRLSSFPGRLRKLRRAHCIREAGGPLQLEIEARLLARMTTEEIAESMGISRGVVEAYEAMFFSVREFLDCKEWILLFATDVVGPAALPDARLWRACAYLGGRRMVQFMLECLKPRDRVLDLHTIHSRLHAWLGRFVFSRWPTSVASSCPGTGSEVGIDTGAASKRCCCHRTQVDDHVGEKPGCVAEKPSPVTPPPGTANGRPAWYDEPPVVPGYPQFWDDEEHSYDAEDDADFLREFEERRAQYHGRA